ncbi:MAG: hypothetical protein E7399_06335 [Ruminococcaceae bacterium]|nr:hypothetical protein [Oscillospiraceae bacterium]
MNFITEKLYFAKFKRTYHLTTGEIVLWDALFMASNCVGLGKKFTVSDKLLCVDCSMSQNGLANARKGLIKAGLLVCSPYKPGEHRVYQLKSLEQIMQSQYRSQNFLPETDCVNGAVSDTVTGTVTDCVTDTVSYNINNKREIEKQYKTKEKRIPQFSSFSSHEVMDEDDLLAQRIQEERVRKYKEQMRGETFAG